MVNSITIVAGVRPLVSLVMIVKDETDELVRCVKSLAAHSGESCFVVSSVQTRAASPSGVRNDSGREQRQLIKRRGKW